MVPPYVKVHMGSPELSRTISMAVAKVIAHPRWGTGKCHGGGMAQEIILHLFIFPFFYFVCSCACF